MTVLVPENWKFTNGNNPVSVFTARQDKLRDVARCMKLTTLKIEREEVETGAVETVFVSGSYKL